LRRHHAEHPDLIQLTRDAGLSPFHFHRDFSTLTGVPLHVFYCYWDARSSYENLAAAEEEDWTVRGRLRAALRGAREIGAQMLELVVWGYATDSEAHEAARDELGQIIQSG
jgi:AraC-like DNA-binding protein